MSRLGHKAKVAAFDIAGGLLMLAALLTGWLPGPGGIPLFLIGLSLIAVHHEWAQRYIDLLREYADRVSDIIFVKDPRIQFAFDCLVPLLLAGGAYLIGWHGQLWARGIGVGICALAIVVLLGNRNRYARLKAKIMLKHKK